jgi:hypothetical protein
MNIYEKLSIARVQLQEAELKKTGENKFAKFKYYELADILPAINSINKELKLISLFEFDSENATLKLINCERSDEVISFEIPNVPAQMKGANPIQELGATSTYLRRYLYLNAYEIQEADVVDSLDKDKHDTAKRPKTQNKIFDKDKAIKACLDIIGDDMDRLDKITSHYKVEGLMQMSEAQLKDCYKNLRK